jgi:signal transduction histidine kinase
VLYLISAFVLYFVAQALPLHWQQALGENPGLWPASAVGLVLILGAPDRKRWLVAMVTLAANLAAHLEVHAVAPSRIVATLLIRLAADWGGAELLARRLGPRPTLERSGPLLQFSLLTGLVITPITSAAGAAFNSATGGPAFGIAFAQWYVSEVVMVLMLVPALWVSRDCIARLRRTSVREFSWGAIAMLVSIVAAAVVTIHPTIAGIALPIDDTLVPLLIVIAYRFGAPLTSWTAVFLFVTVLLVTLSGFGPFVGSTAPGFARNVAVELDCGVSGISLVLLAAILSDLRASSKRFQSYLNTADAPIIAVDLDRRIVGFTAAADAMFRRGANTTLTLGMDPLGPFQGTTATMGCRADAWRRALHGEPDRALLEPDADTRFEMRYEPMRDEHGRVVGAVATAHDLVRQEREEHARVRAGRLEAIGRLAGGVAHDVNNLMTIILGQTFVVRSDASSSPSAAAAVAEIEATVERTKRLTIQLLAFSRAQVLSPTVVALAAQVDAVSSLLRRMVEEHARIEVEHVGAPWNVALDPGQFEQIMLNLAANARDAMPDGGVIRIVTNTATVAGDKADRVGVVPGEYVLLSVQDHGHGISAPALQQIFEPFFTTKGVHGTGLGLATVQSIMLKAGGAITVASVVGEGTTFQLWFPRSLEQASESHVPPSGTPLTPGVGKIIVCEDEPEIRRVVVRTLRNAGYTVHDAATPLLALQELGNGGHDTKLLITDVVMPGMNGMELLRAARVVTPGLRVLLMTGYAEEDVLTAHTAAETADGILAKPFRGEELLDRTRRLLEMPVIS